MSSTEVMTTSVHASENCVCSNYTLPLYSLISQELEYQLKFKPCGLERKKN